MLLIRIMSLFSMLNSSPVHACIHLLTAFARLWSFGLDLLNLGFPVASVRNLAMFSHRFGACMCRHTLQQIWRSQVIYKWRKYCSLASCFYLLVLNSRPVQECILPLTALARLWSSGLDLLNLGIPVAFERNLVMFSNKFGAGMCRLTLHRIWHS